MNLNPIPGRESLSQTWFSWLNNLYSYVIGTTTFATKGSASLPSGLIVKWNTVSVGANASVTDTFATSFPTGAYAAVVTQNGNNVASLAAPGYNNLTTSSIDVKNNQGSTQSLTYIALGY